MSGVSYSPDYEAPKRDGTIEDLRAWAAAEKARIADLERALAAARAEAQRFQTNAIQVETELRSALSMEMEENAQLRAEAERAKAVLRRVALAHCEMIGGDCDEFHDEPDCPQDNTCRCLVRAILGPPESRPAEGSTDAVCEGCGAPATRFDADDVWLCADCYKAAEETDG